MAAPANPNPLRLWPDNLTPEQVESAQALLDRLKKAEDRVKELENEQDVLLLSISGCAARKPGETPYCVRRVKEAQEEVARLRAGGG